MFSLFDVSLFNVIAASGDDLLQAAAERAERAVGTLHVGLI
jgi:hypothetical protein